MISLFCDLKNVENWLIGAFPALFPWAARTGWLVCVFLGGSLLASGGIVDPPNFPGPLPGPADPAGLYQSNVIRGPFQPNTGRWKTLAYGDFESGRLAPAGYTSNLLGFGVGQPPGTTQRLTIGSNAPARGRYYAELTGISAVHAGYAIEANSGFYVGRDQTYVVSALVRIPESVASRARVAMTLWAALGTPYLWVDTSTRDWQFVWGTFRADHAEFVGWMLGTEPHFPSGARLEVDEIAITPLGEFELPRPCDGSRPQPPTPLPPLPVLPLAFGVFSVEFTNRIFVQLIGGGRTVEVRYTTDTTVPSANSPVFSDYIRLTNSTILTAQLFSNTIPMGPVRSNAYYRVDPWPPGTNGIPFRIRHLNPTATYHLFSKTNLGLRAWTPLQTCPGKEIVPLLDQQNTRSPNQFLLVLPDDKIRKPGARENYRSNVTSVTGNE